MKNFIHFETLGCKLNQAESEGAARAFTDAGFPVTMDPLTASDPVQENVCLCVVNTCTVTAKAEQKARRIMRLLLTKCPDSAVLVTGCYAQLNRDEIKAIDERICVLGGQKKGALADLPALLKDFPDSDGKTLAEALQKEFPRPDCRNRIEHSQVIAPEDVDRYMELGVIPTYQTVFIRTDKRVADARWGERMKRAYIWRTMIDKGNKIPNGTDSPVESYDPFLSMYCAVARKDEHGQPEGGWHKEEAMTREEALRSYTIWGAYAAFEEHLKGSIEPGKLADFAVLDRDYMTCPEDEIKDIKVLCTVVGGETVFSRL